MTALQHYIRSITYFDGISDDEVVYILENSIRRTYTASEIIFLEDEPADGLWIVDSGTVKIFKLNPDGGEHILHLRGEGKTFNDIAALDGSNNPANAGTLSNQVTAYLIPSDVLTHILSQNAQVALNVIRLLAKRVRSLVEQIEDLALYSVVVRLARFLLRQEDDPTLSGPGVTRTAIAAHLSTTPQTISVALRELEEAEAITFNRQTVTVLKPNVLQAIALI